MKKLFLMTVAVLFAVTSAFAQGGVNFNEGPMKNLLAKAGSENKYLFLDVYATWCGPCKYMSTEIFTQKAVGDFFNATFVNARIDAEKGEGIDVAKKYEVKAYPTFLILNSKGEEVARIVSGGEADAFIRMTKETLASIK